MQLGQVPRNDVASASAERPRRLRSRLRPSVMQLREELRFRAWSTGTGEGRANHARLKSLGRQFAGRRCFIMGNGPSLLKSDLNRLASEVTIVSNANYLIWDQLEYVPTFLTVEDQLVAADRASELSQLGGITKLFPLDLRPLLGPADEHTLYVCFPREYRSFPRFSHDLSRRVYWGGTVSYLNMQLAAYLGCTTIGLLGFDHNYVVPTDEVKDHVIHSKTADVNHIHPDYFGPGYRWHDPNTERMEHAYRVARRELEARGHHVINATVGGRLEVFERAPLRSILKER